MDRSQAASALLIVWIILSAGALLILMLPFLLPPAPLLALAGRLAIRHDTPCIMCGMTRSFILIARGDLAQAQASNGLALPLFGFLLVNELLVAAAVASRVWRAVKNTAQEDWA
jgi:Protein of unknown function (DUF2752)